MVDQRRDERVKLRIAFEEWTESVDGIRWGRIKRGVKEDCFLSCYQRTMRLPFTEFGMSMGGTDLYWKITSVCQDRDTYYKFKYRCWAGSCFLDSREVWFGFSPAVFSI